MVVQTNHQITKYAVEIKLTRWFVFEWGKPTRQKPHWVILRSPLPRIHYYHNMQLQRKESQYLMPTYSWTLTPIPNWTCSVVTISPFQCMTPSTWLPIMWILVRDLITNLRRMLTAKFFSPSHDEDQEVVWLQNPTVYKHNSFFRRDELRQILSPIIICMNKTLLHTCATCVTFDGP